MRAPFAAIAVFQKSRVYLEERIAHAILQDWETEEWAARRALARLHERYAETISEGEWK